MLGKLETRIFGLYMLILILMTIFSLPNASQFFCYHLAIWGGYDHFSKRKNIQTVQPFRTHILILSMLIEIFCPQYGFSVDICLNYNSYVKMVFFMFFTMLFMKNVFIMAIIHTDSKIIFGQFGLFYLQKPQSKSSVSTKES